MGQAGLPSLFQVAQHVPRTQRALPFFRIVKEVDCRQGAGQAVDVTDADQALLHKKRPFFGEGGIVDEGIGIAVGVLGRMFRPAFGVGLKLVVAVVQLQLGLRHGGPADVQGHFVPVAFHGPALAAIGLKAFDIDAQSPALGT